MNKRKILREKADIVSFINMSIPLEPVDECFIGKCPMCLAPAVSLSVYPDDSSFECHNCGVRGDILDFAMLVLGVNNKQVAVEMISSLFNIEELKGTGNEKAVNNRASQALSTNLKIIEGLDNLIHPAQDFKNGVGYVSVPIKVETEEKGIKRVIYVQIMITSKKK